VPAAAPACRSLGKNLMLIRERAGKNGAGAKRVTEGSNKAVKNQQSLGIRTDECAASG
jgi:hypothetical protein